MYNIMETVNKNLANKKVSYNNFNIGDTIKIKIKVQEANKERFQNFEGIVIAKKNKFHDFYFTIRRISGGIGVERTFSIYNPIIYNIEIKRFGKVRRAKLYFLRKLHGRSAKIKEKRIISDKK